MTLTYCKALPTPIDELNAFGKTQLEMFLSAYTPIFHKAVGETVNFMLSGEDFSKSQWRTHLQGNYGISARHAGGVISAAKGAVDSAKECRQTNWQNLRFQLHNKKRKLHGYQQKIAALRLAPIRVSVSKNQAFIVGCKNESFGNQVCQWDGNNLKFRVPACLESKFGKYIESKIGDFPRNINRLPATGAKTWHFYYKSGSWCAAVSFTPDEVKRVSRSVGYGCIGIDMNPGSIGWAYIDTQGNLKAHGQIPLQTGLPNGQHQAQIVKSCLQLATQATTYQCPIVCEKLDFSTKKEHLRERGRKYARMLSGWAYSQFFKLLNSILSNRGIEVITVNPAYSSIIGLVKYLRMYALKSDESAALVISRRGMRLSEKLPGSLTAFVEVNLTKHVWSLWNKVNNKIKRSGIINRRHDYYTISNWDFLANPERSRREASAPGKNA